MFLTPRAASGTKGDSRGPAKKTGHSSPDYPPRMNLEYMVRKSSGFFKACGHSQAPAFVQVPTLHEQLIPRFLRQGFSHVKSALSRPAPHGVRFTRPRPCLSSRGKSDSGSHERAIWSSCHTRDVLEDMETLSCTSSSKKFFHVGGVLDEPWMFGRSAFWLLALLYKYAPCWSCIWRRA